MLESATEPISVMLRFCASLLFIGLFAWATMNLIQDTRKAGKGKTVFKTDTIILYALALLTATGIYFFLPEKDSKTETHTESAAEVFNIDENTTYVVGTMDEVMEWIQDNEVLYVQSVSQLDNRDTLATWRSLQPQGIPSEAAAASHDSEEFLHYAVIPKEAIGTQTTEQ